jgi:hypothetical protein
VSLTADRRSEVSASVRDCPCAASAPSAPVRVGTARTVHHMPPVSHSDRGLTIVLAVVLAFATALVAWAAYENNEWTRERFALSDEATTLNQRALDLRTAANDTEQRDRQLFIAWFDARTAGAFVKTAALESLFRPRFEKVFRSWLDTGPLNRDGTLAAAPFDRSDYDVSEDRAEAQELARQSRRATHRSDDAARRSSDYSFLTVVFAATLMFVGLANLFTQRPARWMIAGVAIALLLGGAAWLVTLPVVVAL